MQCKDIPEAEFLAAMKAAQVYSIGTNLTALSEELGLPMRLVLAKAKKLIRQGVITGCPCGCRGDFLPTTS